MNVGVNARRLAGQRLGVGRYIEYLLKYWSELAEPGDAIRVYVRDGEAIVNGHSPVPPVEGRLIGPKLTGVTWENLVLPLRARDDVLFCPSYTVPLTYRGASVVAIHSTNEIAPGAHEGSYRFTYSALYRMSARRATHVIVPSQSTLQDLHDLYGIPERKITVVPQGVDETTFVPVDDEERLRAVRNRYFGADRPFLVFVGKLSQRRNIPLLIEAFARLRDQHGIPHGLLLVGPNYVGLPLEELIADHGLSGSVVQTDGRFADHRELVDIYNAAAAYVNASLYEGFSLTLVEALACGTPVVTVNRGALPEIAGDAALVVEEPEIESLSDAIARVIDDAALGDDLRRRGPIRARSFRWEDTARRTWETLLEVAGGR